MSADNSLLPDNQDGEPRELPDLSEESRGVLDEYYAASMDYGVHFSDRWEAPRERMCRAMQATWDRVASLEKHSASSPSSLGSPPSTPVCDVCLGYGYDEDGITCSNGCMPSSASEITEAIGTRPSLLPASLIEAINELETAAKNVGAFTTRYPSALGLKDKLERLTATRTWLEGFFREQQQEIERLRFVMQTEIEARDRFRAGAEYWQGEVSEARQQRDEAARHVRIIDSLFSSLKEDGLRLDWIVENFQGAHFKYGDPADPINVLTIRIPDAARVSSDFRRTIDAARRISQSRVPQK